MAKNYFIKLMEELSEKTGIPVKVLIKISDTFGSINEFKRLYINLMKNSIFWVNGQPLFEDSFKGNIFLNSFFETENEYEEFVKIYRYLEENGKIVTCFDLSKPNLLASKQSINALGMIEKGFTAGKFINEEKLNMYLRENLIPKEVETVFAIAEEHDENETQKEFIRRRFNISTQALYQRLKAIRKKLEVCQGKESIYEDIDSMRRASIIEAYFKNCDVFITADNMEMEPEKRAEILNPKMDISRKMYTTEIEKIGLSNKTYNWLKRNGCDAISDVIEKILLEREKHLTSGFGNERKLEIEEKLGIIDISIDLKTKKHLSKDADKELKELIKQLDSAYAELLQQEQHYIKLREKVLKVLEEKANLTTGTLAEEIEWYQIQVRSASRELREIKKKKTLIERKYARDMEKEKGL